MHWRHKRSSVNVWVTDSPNENARRRNPINVLRGHQWNAFQKIVNLDHYWTTSFPAEKPRTLARNAQTVLFGAGYDLIIFQRETVSLPYYVVQPIALRSRVVLLGNDNHVDLMMTATDSYAFRNDKCQKPQQPATRQEVSVHKKLSRAEAEKLNLPRTIVFPGAPHANGPLSLHTQLSTLPNGRSIPQRALRRQVQSRKRRSHSDTDKPVCCAGNG